MKIIHWAIIFIVLILPFSIICRDTINKKNLVLQDQTRMDNILDAATYDGAGAMLEELADVLGYGENIPITHDAAMAAIDRFFQTMAVNFNLPANIEVAKDYFGQYIPVIAIVGYDGMYVYSYELTDEGYKYVLKPKIPYSYTDPTTNAIISFTLGTDIKIYLPTKKLYFEGKLSEVSAQDIEKMEEIVNAYTPGPQRQLFISEYLPGMSKNLSLILRMTKANFNGADGIPDYLLEDGITHDYVYDDQQQILNGKTVDGEYIPEISEFHEIRRETIVNLISAVLRQEVNEHDTYADLIGVNYNFNIPSIGRDQWNNTINDISVLAFFQGMPIGSDSYYNNYSLGGARIIKAHRYYGTNADMHYHKHNCPLIMTGDELDYDKYDIIFNNVDDALQQGYYACKECR